MVGTTSLPAPYDDLREQALELARRVEAVADEADGSSVVHPLVLGALRASGLVDLVVPGAYGGRFDRVDPLAICVVREMLMATSSHLDSLFALQGIGSYAISVGGSDEQRSRWLPRVASTDALAALAISEPMAGSDLKAVTTTAHAEADRIEITGEKAFISNAGAAAFYTVFVREGDSFSVFLVPADREGVRCEPLPELIAPHVIGNVRFDRVAVSDADRLGERGRGLDLILATLTVFRASVAGAAVGLAWAALEEAVRHARRREQFGRPLVRLGPVAQLLADSWTEVEMARLLTYRAAAMARDGHEASLAHASMAKLAATEAASRVVDRSVQVMGRFGLIRGSKIERLYRQARPMRIYEGASEVLRLAITSQLCREVS